LIAPSPLESTYLFRYTSCFNCPAKKASRLTYGTYTLVTRGWVPSLCTSLSTYLIAIFLLCMNTTSYSPVPATTATTDVQIFIAEYLFI
jgi:hypothetical protein